MLMFTKFMLAALGLAAVAIGTMIFLAGPDFTASFFGKIVESTLAVPGYSGGLEHINVDSEMRFYSVFWIAYGACVLWLASRAQESVAAVFGALGLFFLGGLGRMISFVFVGTPDLLFVILMYLELAGPIVVAMSFGIALRRKG